MWVRTEDGKLHNLATARRVRVGFNHPVDENKPRDGIDVPRRDPRPGEPVYFVEVIFNDNEKLSLANKVTQEKAEEVKEAVWRLLPPAEKLDLNGDLSSAESKAAAQQEYFSERGRTVKQGN